jgi:hypothetical protein
MSFQGGETIAITKPTNDLIVPIRFTQLVGLVIVIVSPLYWFALPGKTFAFGFALVGWETVEERNRELCGED